LQDPHSHKNWRKTSSSSAITIWLDLALHLRLVLAGYDVSFVDVAQPVALENLDEEL
jgi:hypothetical protein